MVIKDFTLRGNNDNFFIAMPIGVSPAKGWQGDSVKTNEALFCSKKPNRIPHKFTFFASKGKKREFCRMTKFFSLLVLFIK